MKKWKIVKTITIVILILAIAYLLYDLFICLSIDYPVPMLGVDAYNWTDLFLVDCMFFFFVFGIPLVIDIILLIVSLVKIKKIKTN